MWVCPQCKGEDGSLHIHNVTTSVEIDADGESAEQEGDLEWESTSPADCTCGWSGTAGDCEVEEMPDAEDEQRWTNHYFHCNTQWDDTWSCQCNDECPVCHAEIEPYASVDNSVGDESGEIIHVREVYDQVIALQVELVCSACRETNFALPNQVATKPCDDCGETGTLVPFAEIDAPKTRVTL